MLIDLVQHVAENLRTIGNVAGEFLMDRASLFLGFTDDAENRSKLQMPMGDLVREKTRQKLEGKDTLRQLLPVQIVHFSCLSVGGVGSSTVTAVGRASSLPPKATGGAA